MLVAQITDIHIGFDPGNPDEYNQLRFDAILGEIARGPNRPEALLLTGDLTDLGDDDSYARLAASVAAFGVPIIPCVGNHDDRDAFSRAFPGFTDEAGFVQYERDLGPLRLIVVDTLEPGRHGGAFCETRAAWLSARLAERPETPTFIVMHHPPIDCGIEWMTTHNDEPWVRRFRATVAGAGQLRGLICGHLHRSIAVSWAGLTVAICSSSAPQVTLDLSPIDPDSPDKRAMIIAEDPAYALHYWNGQDLISFFHQAGHEAVLARFDEKLQPLVRTLINERPM
jgi:3',5'-cyclic-AMP phosphodiesterase